MIPVLGTAPEGAPTLGPVPTSSFQEPLPTPGTGSGPPLILTLILLSFFCIFALLIGVIILTVVVRSQKSKGAPNDPA